MQHEIQTVRLSNRGYGMLKYLEAAPKHTLNAEQVGELNQLTVGGNKRREFITETSDKRGITITPEGRAAIRAFDSAEFFRKVANTTFSSYITLEVYEGKKHAAGHRDTPRPARRGPQPELVRSRARRVA